MKHGIFISYSDFDKEKVDLIVSELENNTKFYSIVIAFIREPLKPLAEKIATGIKEAQIILPIMTAKSIKTQWINQEIGFATALGRRIMPIAESGIIDELKGFIHKQIDLPYQFNTNDQESFIKQVKQILHDLDKTYNNIVNDLDPIFIRNRH